MRSSSFTPRTTGKSPKPRPARVAVTKTIIEGFKKAINALTVQDRGNAEIRDRIKLRQTRPFVAKEQGFLIPKRSVFNRIIGEGSLELDFAIVETKGLEELELPLKMARLKQWCEDMNQAQSEVRYDFVYVDEESFKKYRPSSFAGLVESFREYKDLWQGAGGEG